MKILLVAATAAFAFVTPAAAQTAPAQPAHQHGADHSQHQGDGQQQGHGEHDGHGSHAQTGQAGHGGHGAQANCCADANGNGRMDCCEGANAAQRPCCAGHQHDSAQPTQQAAPAQPQN